MREQSAERGRPSTMTDASESWLPHAGEAAPPRGQLPPPAYRGHLPPKAGGGSLPRGAGGGSAPGRQESGDLQHTGDLQHSSQHRGSFVITARASATFEPVGRSVATARGFVRDTLQGWGFAEVVDDAVVLASELVTNAVVHAGTAADVLCLRSPTAVRIEVSDHYPEREIPLHDSATPEPSPDREGGRGLLLCSALANRWGVEYTPIHKQVWFQIDLPERPAGTRAAGPLLPLAALPLTDLRVHVAVVQVDRCGIISGWNEDAETLFGHTADHAVGVPLSDLAAWPQTPGTGFGLAEALRLSRWEGSYGIRGADGKVQPVYGSHLRVRNTAG